MSEAAAQVVMLAAAASLASVGCCVDLNFINMAVLSC